MPLVSVVIPTRNRSNCAFSLIKMVLKNVKDCEVIVCDNSDQNDLGQLLQETLYDKRVIYRYKKNRLSVVENFNWGLEYSTGDYLIYMGDDDLIGPNFEETILWAKANNIDLLLSNFKEGALQYFWPGVSSVRWNGIGGSMFYSKYTGAIGYLDSKKASVHALKRLGSGPLNMPRIYLGLVSKAAIKKVEEKYGALFGGISPDVYSSTLLSSLNLNARWIDYPFVIPGVSSLSTSAARSERVDVGRLDDAEGVAANDHLKGFSNLQWDKRIPLFYSPYTVWAYSHVAALRRIEKTVPVRSLVYLYATCLIFAPQHFKAVYKAIMSQRDFGKFIGFSVLTLLMVPYVLLEYFSQKIRLLKNPKPGGAHFKISNLSDSGAAYKALEAEFVRSGLKPRFH